MCRAPKVLLCLVVICLLPFVGCAKARGNGSGYGGGNPALNQAQTSLGLALRELRWGFDPSSFGTFTSCANIADPYLCNELANLNQTQVNYLRAFLLNGDPTLGPAVISQMTPMVGTVPFDFQQDPLTVTGPGGTPLVVTAKTLFGPTGDILFSTDMLQIMTSNQILRVVTHEFGHKVAWGGSDVYMTDNQLVYDGTGNLVFDSEKGDGRRFLDSFGTAMVGYIADHNNSAPVTFPDATFTCDPGDLATYFDQAPYFSAGHNGGQLSNDTDTFFNGVTTGPSANCDTFSSPQTTDFSIVIWAKLDATAANDFGTGTSGDNILISGFLNDDGIHGIPMGIQMGKSVYNGNFYGFMGTQQFMDSGIKITPNVFHQFVLIKLGAVAYTYVDGVAGTSYPAMDGGNYINESDNCKPLYIGRASTSDNYWPPGTPTDPNGTWQGNIASVMIYKYGLQPSEVANLYQCGKH